MVLNGTYYKLATHKRTKQIVGHKRYQTVWYLTERIINLRPTSEPSNCGPQAVPDCMVLNGTYYKLATHKRTKQIVGHKRYQTVWYSTERIINLRPTSEPSNCGPQAVPDCMVHNGTYYKLATHQRTNLYGLKCSKLWAASSTRLYGTQRNVLHISVPSHLLATSGTRLYGTY